MKSPVNRSITVSCENCSNTPPLLFTPSEFEDFLDEGEFNCSSCSEELSVDGVRVECYICDAEFEDYSLSELPSLLEERCSNCAGREEWDADFYSKRIAGSWSWQYDIYDWAANRKRIEHLERKGRTDYWEGLVHFCTAEQFISIYKDRRIRASSTGLYGRRNPDKTKAVCLTEATRPNWDELKETHGEYGFVFRKRDVIGLKGAPAIYLPQAVLDDMNAQGQKLPETLWPYVNKLTLRTNETSKYDYLHEREWRVPQDISFDTIEPYAVTFAKVRPGIEGEGLILFAAQEFQELSDPDGSVYQF